MGNHRERRKALLMDELREIIQVTRVTIASAYYVGGITVTTEIGRNDVKSISKSLRNPVPIMTVVSVAMHKQQWRRSSRCDGDGVAKRVRHAGFV